MLQDVKTTTTGLMILIKQKIVQIREGVKKFLIAFIVYKPSPDLNLIVPSIYRDSRDRRTNLHWVQDLPWSFNIGSIWFKKKIYKCPFSILMEKLPCSAKRNKNDCNGGKWQSGISKSLEEYVQHHVCFGNVKSSLHENVIISGCACVDNACILYLSCGIPYLV